jgi:hypothetical protein
MIQERMLAMAKQCGNCTQCCKVMEIVELEKPNGIWCDHCKVGKGCSIYNDRPESCRSFSCQWLLDESMPHRLRPDQTKVVVYIDHEGQRLVARCDTANPMAWRREPFYIALKRWSAGAFGQGRQVMAAAGHRLWVIAPNLDLDLGEVDPKSPVVVEEMPDGTVKASILPPVEGAAELFKATPKPLNPQ